MQCPLCHQELTGVDYCGVHIETCPACGGDWVASDELGNIVKARQTRFTPEECMAVAKAATIHGTPVTTSSRHLSCPKCGGQTKVENYGYDSGIMIDRCDDCGGVWLDKGELDKIDEVVQGWDDELPEEMKEFGPKLKQLAQQIDQEEYVHVSHFKLINAMINGILDFLKE
jgi:Zn-finger nucleic acid-binding protein